MEVRDVRLVEITVSNNRRTISKAAVGKLAESILDIGLQNPIGLTADLRLIHGRHRLEAYRLLQRTEIPASIHDLDDIHAELAEIDENIQRRQLNAVDECKALARRKELYVSLHPETKRGTAGANAKHKKPATDNLSFASHTAEKTGKSARSVERDVALGNSIPDEIVEKIADSPVADNKSELKKLAKLEPEQQRVVADLLSEGEVQSVTEALKADDEPKSEPEPSEILIQRLRKVVDKWMTEYRASVSLAAASLENLADMLLSERKTKKRR